MPQRRNLPPSYITETTREGLFLPKQAGTGRNNTSLGLEKLEKSYFSLFIFCLWLRLYLVAADCALRSINEDDLFEQTSQVRQRCFTASIHSPKTGKDRKTRFALFDIYLMNRANTVPSDRR